MKYPDDPIPIFYLHIHRKLAEHKQDSLGNIKVSTNKASYLLALSRIPKTLRFAILKEMENFGLITSLNRESFIVVNIQASRILEDSSKINKVVGLW